LVAVLNQRGVRYAIIDGLAVLHYTRVRATEDIDAMLNVPQLAMPGLFEALKESGFDVDVMKNIRELRDEGITTIRYSGVIVDLMRPVIPAYAHALERAIDAQVFGQTVRVSSAEGLIIMKLAAMRPQDEADIQELLSANTGRLDLDFIRREFESFSEADDPRRAKLDAWIRATHGPDSA
jgi:predicted nucleotidyltransferase